MQKGVTFLLLVDKKGTPLFLRGFVLLHQIRTYVMICWSVLKRKVEQAALDDATRKGRTIIE
jgi:hypothetical protein